jgi:hypothetical protein
VELVLYALKVEFPFYFNFTGSEISGFWCPALGRASPVPGGEFLRAVQSEDPSLRRFFRLTETFHVTPGAPVYAFSAIFRPRRSTQESSTSGSSMTQSAIGPP